MFQSGRLFSPILVILSSLESSPASLESSSSFVLSNVGLVHTVLVRISILTQPQSSTHHGMMSHVIQVLNIDDLDSAAVLLLRTCSDSHILPSGTI